MIEFKSITVNDKQIYKKYAEQTPPQGCEVGFCNLFLWGEQKIQEEHGNLLMLSSFSKSIYPFPMGNGDIKKSIDAIINDAKERGIPCIISSVYPDNKAVLDSLYTNQFEFVSNRDWADYLYRIEDLASLVGKKYHKKRTHLNNFQKNHQGYSVEAISSKNLSAVIDLVNEWYITKEKIDAEADFAYEKKVFRKAMDNYYELGLEGICITWQGKLLAVTFGSRLNDTTFDVHFEKADSTVDGAYTVVNYEYANYIKNKYPEIEFLNREDDMGLEGLRKAKLSYKPFKIIEKYRAIYKGEQD